VDLNCAQRSISYNIFAICPIWVRLSEENSMIFLCTWNQKYKSRKSFQLFTKACYSLTIKSYSTEKRILCIYRNKSIVHKTNCKIKRIAIYWMESIVIYLPCQSDVKIIVCSSCTNKWTCPQVNRVAQQKSRYNWRTRPSGDYILYF